MAAIISALLADLWPYILAGIGGLLLIFQQRRAGAAKERARQDRARIDAIKDRKGVDNEVDSLGHADLDKRFDRWLSNDKR